MSLINWDENFSTFIEVIDEQHRELIDTINILSTSIENRNSSHDICLIIKFLIDYSKFHINAEEKMIISVNNEGQVQHLKEHAEFKKNMKYIVQTIDENGIEPYAKLLDFLKEWVISHIINSDKIFANQYIQSRIM